MTWLVFELETSVFSAIFWRSVGPQTADRSRPDRTGPDLSIRDFVIIVVSSYHHIIMSSCHHIIISSYRHGVISSYHHVILSSYHHITIPSYHHIVISSYQQPDFPEKRTRHFSKNLDKRPGESSIRKGFRHKSRDDRPSSPKSGM